MAEPIDLDTLREEADYGGTASLSMPLLDDLIAELRAARKVVEAARRRVAHELPEESDLGGALAEYDALQGKAG